LSPRMGTIQRGAFVPPTPLSRRHSGQRVITAREALALAASEQRHNRLYSSSTRSSLTGERGSARSRTLLLPPRFQGQGSSL
jgi:hypothetical protein